MVTRAADRVEDSRWSQALRAAGLLGASESPGPPGASESTGPPGPSALERPARLAARLLGTPAALVVLADGDRQVCLASAGPVERWTLREDRPLRPLLRQVVETGTPLVVGDARACGRPDAPPYAAGAAVPACAAFPLRAPDGEVLGALCALDVRPRRWDPRALEQVAEVAGAVESQLATRLSEGRARLAAARLDTVLERTPDAFVTIDGAGRVAAWNPAAERLFGRPAAEAVGRPVDRLIIPQRSRREFTEELRRVRENGGPPPGYDVELTAVDRTGREIPVEMTLQAGDECGEPVLHAFLHDIGDRLVARRQLEKERTFLSALLDSLDIAVVACDGAGRLMFNQMMRETLRSAEQPDTVEEWAEVYRLYAPDGMTPLRREEMPLVRILAGERLDDEQVVVHLPGAGPRRLLVNGRPIETADGRRLGAVAAAHDITDRHRVERLRAAQRAAARALAAAGSSGDAAREVVTAVADTLGWDCGEYWQVDPGEESISRLGLWTRPGRDLSAFTHDQPDVLPPGEGLAGMVWATGRAVWIPDLAADPRDFTRKQAALRTGLRAAMGLPVRSGRQILGVLTFFTCAVQEEERDLVDMLDGVRAHVGRHMERRRTEELALELSASRRHLDQIIAQIDDYVWTVEIASDGTVRPVFTSPDSTAVFGGPIPPGTDGLALMAERIHPDDLPAFIAFHEAVASGGPARTECRVLGLDGVTRWVWIRALPRREGDRLFVDGISTDVTERHRMEEERERLLAREREQVRRLRELDRMKDELVALVSHELRAPIGAIRACTEMLLDDPGLDEEHRMFAGVIGRRSTHLQRLVDDLLDLARLDSGGIAVDPRPLSLTQLVRQAVDDHRAAAEAKRLTVTSDTAEGLTVRADPVRLRQVMDNLLSNAIKYTPDGGAVEVVAGRDGSSGGGAAGGGGVPGVRDEPPGVKGEDSGGPGAGAGPGTEAGSGAGAGPGTEAVVSVADTGIGIPPEQYPRLFGRFFRASTAVKSGIKGTGLGLAITKAIVEAHDGTITASPREGGGTVFTVRLPEIRSGSAGD
ncbi:hypothetical protein GCM10010466_58840 [Planomonospora alba]|uniref:Sensor-like histidine kinase SenX3 n=1 Tax=Planomonospora alba TaxID=161354 RepID=A0ABP6P1S0_9ACTN